MSRAPVAQTAASIFDRRLRDGAEHESPHGRQTEQGRDHARGHLHAHAGRQTPAARDKLEGAIGGGDQTAGEADPLRLVAFENPLRRPPAEHRRQLPGQVHRIADAGVHSLSTDRAVDVGRIAEEERPSLLEARRHAVMHAIRREPVHAAHVDAQTLQETLAHVVPVIILAPFFRPGPDGADQPDAIA